MRITLTAEQEGELLLAVNDARLTLAALAGEDPEPSMLADWLLDLIAELSELQLAELPEVTDDDGGATSGRAPGLTGPGPFGTPFRVA